MPMKWPRKPRSSRRPGFLGVQYAPLNTGATPRAGQPFSVRGMSLQGGLTISELEKRIAKTDPGTELDKLITQLDHFKTVDRHLTGTAMH